MIQTKTLLAVLAIVLTVGFVAAISVTPQASAFSRCGFNQQSLTNPSQTVCLPSQAEAPATVPK